MRKAEAMVLEGLVAVERSDREVNGASGSGGTSPGWV